MMSQDPNSWQDLYLKTRAPNRNFRQLFFVSIAFFLFVAWVSSIAILLSFLSGYTETSDKTVPFFLRLVTWSRILLPVISIGAGIFILINIAQNFVSDLFQTPLETEITERVWHRLWGWYGFSSFRKYMLIKDTKLKPVLHWSTWLGGPTYLVIFDGFAVYLEQGNHFSRVVGAGLPMPYLDARETIKAVVDLRPQIREATVNAWTNDGIKVALRIRVEFQIVSTTSKDSGSSKLVYPYDPQAVRKAVEYTAVRLRDGKLQEVDWREGTTGSITGLIARHISSHHLDELFMQNESEGQILSPQVMKALLERATKQLGDSVGVRVNSFQIIDISIPTEVRYQRLNVWAAQKDSLVSRIQGEAQAYRIRTNEEARARAQRDLIVAIAKSLGRVDPSHFPEPLLLSLSGILDQGLKDPLVQTYMTQGALDSLKQLKDLL
jgi:regulator of protease activity HflC (stomatin/prohibitin superfamily)